MADNNYTLPEPILREEKYLSAIANNTAGGGGGGKVVIAEKTITANGTYNAVDDNANAYNPVTVNVPNSYTAQDEGKVVSSGALVSQTAYPSTITQNDTYDTTNYNSITVNVTEKTNWLNSPIGKCRPTCSKWMDAKYWIPKTWTGLTNFDGNYIWTDGTDIYFSIGSNQYVLDKSTSTWTTKTWNGYNNILGEEIWTDGENIYYSNNTYQYVLDKSTSTWVASRNQIGTYGSKIWSDGENIYSSYDVNQYVFNKSTSTWTAKTWTGLTNPSGNYIWTDGENIYYSLSSTQYVLDKATSTWTAKTWTGLTNFNGDYIWTDGINIYYTDGSSTRYMLNKETSTWSTRVWTGLTNFNGKNIWTDGTDIYYSYGSNQYVLSTPTLNNTTITTPTCRCLTSI